MTKLSERWQYMEAAPRDNTRERPRQFRPYDIVRVVLASVLIIAATLKANQLVTSPAPEIDVFTARWFLIAAVEFELAAGIWLLFGLYPILTVYATVALFFVFAGVSLVHALRGDTSCGCFGNITISPWSAAGFDAVAAAAMWYFRSPFNPAVKPRRHVLRVATLLLTCLAICLPAGAFLSIYRPAALTASGEIVGESKAVVLEPKAWVGRTFPLFEHIDIGERLRIGRWRLVFYRDACAKCRELVAHYQRLAKNDVLDRETSLVFVELPPIAYTSRDNREYDPTSWLYASVSERRRWFLPTPVEVVLDSGIVAEVRTPRGATVRAQTPPVDQGTAHLDFYRSTTFVERNAEQSS